MQLAISVLNCQTSVGIRLSQNRVGNPRPVGQAIEYGVRHDCLSSDERKQNAKVDSVHTPLDEDVANHTEKNQQIHSTTKVPRWKQPLRKAPKCRGS